MDRAIPFIQKAVAEGKPFMATIWFHTPHSPVVAGPKYLKIYEGYKEGEQHYFGCITAMDEQIGRLRDELKKLGIDKNTAIWFCSDNGPEGIGKPRAKYDAYHGAFYGKAGQFRGRKRSLLNGGVCVPALMVQRYVKGSSTAHTNPATNTIVADTSVVMAKIAWP